VPGLRPGALEQPLADVERGDGVAEADLDRLGGPLPRDPTPKRLALGGARCDREDLVEGTVRARSDGALADQALYHAPHPPRRRIEFLMVSSAHAPIPPIVRSAPPPVPR
jgi:hypothetical protein